MIYGSVCSGIEAATVAWHPTSWRPAFFAEIEKFPRAVLKHHYPEVPLHGDFTTIQPGDYEPIDLLVGGTPCQDFSVAGLRAGLAGERGNLTLEFVRLAGRLRPAWIVWENVPGVLSDDGGRSFGAFLGALAVLGYGFAYRVLDAQYAGLAQRRERVFVVGHLGDWRCAAAVLFERESLSGDPPPRREAGERVARPVAGGSPSSGGHRLDADTAESLIPLGLGSDGEIARALNGCHTASGRHDVSVDTFIAHSLRADGFDASEDGTGRGTPLVPVAVRTAQTSANGHGVAEDVTHTLDGANGQAIAYRTSPNCGAWETGDRTDSLTTGTDKTSTVIAFDTTQITHPENRSNPQPGGPAPCLAKGGHAPAIAFSCKDHGADVGELAPTLRAMGHDGSHANAGGQLAVATSMAVRRLTPRECERLQGFPDDYTAIPYRGKLAADGPRYKALGNSMAVPCMRWIGRRIELVSRLKNGGTQ